MARFIHRAFPELDRFNDERCRRFVAAALASWPFRIQAWPILGALVLVGLASAVFAAHATMSAFEGLDAPHAPSVLANLLAAGAMAASVAPPVLATLFVRDWLLRRRIARLLRARGVCAACRYSLVGLAPVADGLVICPECALGCEVDPALGELVADARGVSRYQPRPRSTWLSRWWTPRIKRAIGRTAMLVLAAGVVTASGLGLRHVWINYRLQRQAQSAQALRRSWDDLLRAVAAEEPTGAAEFAEAGESAWTLLEKAVGLQAQLEADSTPRIAVGVNGRPVEVRYWLMGAELESISTDQAVNPEWREEERASRELTRQVLAACRTPELLSALRAIATSPCPPADVSIPARSSLYFATLPWQSPAQQLARFTSACAIDALDRADVAAFGQHFETTLALARMLARQPLVPAALGAMRIEQDALLTARRALARRPSAEVLDAIERALDRQDSRVPRQRLFQADRVASCDSVCWAFSEPAWVQGEFRSDDTPSELRSGPRGPRIRIGTLEENLAEVNRGYDILLGRALDDGALLDGHSGLYLAAALFSHTRGFLRQLDIADLERAGVRAWIAIERFRVAHGRPPDALSQLVPDFLPALPIDPLSREPLILRLVDPAVDREGRDFLLYARGPDGQDDAGNTVERRSDQGRKDAPGTDFVINRRD